MAKIHIEKIRKGDSGEESSNKIYANDVALRSGFENLDEKIKNISSKTSIIKGTIFKGNKANVDDIKSDTKAIRGDVYRALDTGHYWIYSGTDTAPYDADRWAYAGDTFYDETTIYKSLYNVSQQKTNYAYADKHTARADVPEDVRSQGQIISYYSKVNKWLKNTAFEKQDAKAVSSVDGKVVDQISTICITIDLKAYIAIRMRAYATSGILGGAFFGSDGKFIELSGFKFTSNEVPAGEFKEIRIPADAEKIKITYYSDATATANNIPVWDYVELLGSTGTSEWVTEQFIATDTAHWDTDANWKEIGLQVSQEMGQDTDKAPSLKLFTDEIEKKSGEMAHNKEEIKQLLAQKSEEIDGKLEQMNDDMSQALTEQAHDLTAKIDKKADGCYLNGENKLQLTSEGTDIGTPIELPSGIINLSYKDNREYESPEAARNMVKKADRIIGQIITYKMSDGAWYLDQFAGQTIGSWSSNSSWTQYALKADITPLLLDIDNLKVKMESLSSSIEGKADGIETDDVDENNMAIVLTSNGSEIGRVTVPKGGGGGGGPTTGVVMKMKSTGTTSIVVSKGEDAIINFNWTSIDTTDNSSTGAGNISVTIGGFPVYANVIEQGDNSINLKNYLNDGANIVKVRVTDSYQNYRTLTYTIQLASLLLTSTFADDTLYETSPVQFRYTLQGSGRKTIRFWLNGTEIASETTDTSNKPMTKDLTGLTAGTNSIRVVAESTVGGYNLKSNELYYEFVYIGAGLNKPAIVMSYNKTAVKQFELLEIPYVVYDPSNDKAKIELCINGVIKQKLTVGRKQQLWSYLAQEQGSYKMEIRCGAVSKSVTIEVEPSEYDITEEKGNLQYKASAVGKSNAADDRDSWKYGNYDTVFNDFTWGDDGWQRDGAGNNHLRLISDSNIHVGIDPFSKNILQEGMTLTIEFATENVINPDAVIMSCLSNGIGIEVKPNLIKLQSAQTELTANLDSSTKVSVSFVVQRLNEKRLMLLFIDGIMSGAVQYASNDNLSQPNPAGLNVSTGKNSCIAMLYNIRWYSNSLDYSQIFNNYLFDIENLDEKTAKFEFNNILDNYGKIDYNKALDYLPCLTFIGDLPQAKKDFKVCDLLYEDRKNPKNSFSATNIQNDVQGTSSQAYPRKNYKFKFEYKVQDTKQKADVTLTETGEKIEAYSMLGTQIPAKTFCMKADFAESSGTHNTGFAVLVDEALRKLGYTIPPQAEDKRIRTTVFGYPCLVFHKQTASDQPTFLGKYNFNDDKSSEQVFGFKEGMECWEFLNNTSDICLFKGADFDSMGVDGKGNPIPQWLNDLEGRFPDGHTDATNIKPLWQWVVSCIGNPTKFKQECKNHFNEKWLVFYCLTNEISAGVDQRGKNQMITTYGERGATGELIWYFIYYDNDTIFGVNNEGRLTFNPFVESQDEFGSAHVWNAWSSELWKLVETAYKDEITSLYAALSSTGAMSLKSTLNIFQTRHADLWSETVYNHDGNYKYIGPVVSDNDASYLYALQGSRSRHRIWWLTNRFFYMDSKYFSGEYKAKFAHIRVNTPAGNLVVPPKVELNVTINRPMYVRSLVSSYKLSAGRGEAGKTYKMVPPNIQYNNTEVFIYGARGIKSLGDLSAAYPGESVNVVEAVALEDLIIGSTKTGYENNILKTLSLGNNTLLREINVANCKVLNQSLELGKCYSLKKIEARGSVITGVALPDKGVLEEMYLPATVTSIYLKNQPNLKKFEVEGYANLNTIVVENVPGVNGYDMVKSCIGIAGNKLSMVRLININASDTNSKVLNALSLMTGEDENGRPTDTAVVTGKIIINQISQDALDYLKRVFPNLQIDYNEILDVINIVDPIMSKIAVDKWDTNGDGQLSANEVALETIPSNLLQGTGVKTFNEAHFWKGNNSIIDNCDTLESVAIRTGNSTIKNLPDLKTIYIYQGKEDSLIADPLLITQTSLTNAYMIENWNLVKETADFRYIIGKNGGSILGKINSNLGQYYKLCYPWRDRDSLTIYEPLFFDDVINKTYPWLNLLQTINLQNCVGLNLLYNTTIKIFNIKGIGWANGEGAGISLGNGGSIVNEINISNGKLAYLRIGVGGNNRYQSIKIADDVYADEGTNIGWSNYNGGNYNTANSISLLDLGKNIKGNICCYNWAAANYYGRIKKLIIRNTEKVLPLIIIWTNYTDAVCDEVYVPDNLYDAYKTENNWSKFPNAIKKISMLS